MPLNPDSIPTSEQVRETLLDRIYYPYQKQIWAVGIVLAIAIVGYLAAVEYRIRRLNEQWSRRDAAVSLRAGEDDPTGVKGAEARIAALERLIKDFPEDPVTPYALTELMTAQRQAERYDDSLQTLTRLRTEHRDFLLNSELADPGASGQPRSLADRVEAATNQEKEWARQTKYVHPEPAKDTLALVETTAGSFWLAFYKEQAPLHVARFIARAKAGEFNGTQVYHLRTGGTPEAPTPMLFEAGSSASRHSGPGAERDPGLHDRDEPLATIEPEDARESIRHVRGVVSAVTMPSGESADRFMVVCAKDGLSRFDGQTTPFAAVLLDREGSGDVVDRISTAPTYWTDPTTKSETEVFRMREHPYPPIWIRRVTVYRDERPDAGHAWSTAKSGTKEPEDWEATLPAPPKPNEFAPKPVSTPVTEPKPGDGSTSVDPAPPVKPGDEKEPAKDEPAK